MKLLDLGANGGGVPLMLDRLGYRLGKVVAVELNPNTYGRLCFNLYRNLDCELVLLNAGAADRDGTIELELGGGSIGDSIFGGSSNSGGKKRRIGLIALDTVIGNHFGESDIDLCKIDIEGAEFAILASDCSDALKKVRNVIIEIHSHPDYSEEWVHERLDRLGFERLDVTSPYEANVFGYTRR